VVIKVDGADNGVLPNGTSIKEPFIRQKLNMDNRANVDVATANSMQVYFISEEGLLVPTTALIAEEPTLETTINKLVEGPAESGTLMSVLPEGTKVLDVSLEEGVAVINFSSEIEKITDQEDGGISAVKAVMLTAMQFPDVQEVYIRSDGKDLDVETTLPTYANMV
jgi:germination protein M